MNQGVYRIVSNEMVAKQTYRIVLEGPGAGFERGGQFADVALEGRFLRRPLAVTCWDENHFTMMYKVVGEGTAQMSRMTAGQSLDVLTGLGNGFDAALCRDAALVVCGGLGVSPVFSLVKELLALGRKVTVVAGFNTADEMLLTAELAELGADVHVATMDGSVGTKGFVTDCIAALKPEFDFFYCCGPMVMMKAVCAMLPTSGQVSLEERMGCGVGICYGCTCHTIGGARRICADGPVFMKEDVVW